MRVPNYKNIRYDDMKVRKKQEKSASGRYSSRDLRRLKDNMERKPHFTRKMIMDAADIPHLRITVQIKTIRKWHPLSTVDRRVKAFQLLGFSLVAGRLSTRVTFYKQTMCH